MGNSIATAAALRTSLGPIAPHTALKGSPMPLDSIPAYSGFRGGHVGPAYNEAAFRHFLAVDRRRAGRSARSVLLILVAVQESLGTSVKLTDASASALFRELAASVREVDFVGWYREGYVAAAVLAQGVRASGEVPNVITKRVLFALKNRLSTDLSRNLRVRVVRLGGRLES